MKFTLLIKTALITAAFTSATAIASCPEWMNTDLKKLRSKDTVNLCELADSKPVLLVNTASQCGFTPQFEDLEALYNKYKNQGLQIVGFPSDSFKQEHDDAEKTAEVCYINYGVTFTMLETSPVRGPEANAIFEHLGEALGSPSWNFNKYLVDGNGTPIKKFGSRTKPLSDQLINAVESVL